MKGILRILLLTVGFVMMLSFTAQALTLPGLGGSTGNETIVITGSPEDLQKDIVFLDEGETLDVSHFPMGNLWAYLDSNGRGQILQVNWDVTAEELSQPGLHLVTGTPVLTEDFSLADGYDGVITYPVFRHGDGAVLEITSLHQPTIALPLVSYGGDPDTELQVTTKVTEARTAEGYTIGSSIEGLYWQWDTSAVNTAVTGTDTITRTLCCPEWISVPETYLSKPYSVYVMPTDRIELWAITDVSTSGLLTFRWLYSKDNVSDLVLQQKNADGQWAACDPSWYRYTPGSASSNGFFTMNLLRMPQETELTLHLRYLDSGSGAPIEQFTQPISMTIPGNIAELLAASGESIPVKITPLDGDRDGGDSQGDELPDYSQPAPSASPTPSASLTPSPSPSAEPSPSPAPEFSPSPSVRPSPEASPSPSVCPSPEPSLSPSAPPSPQAFPIPSSTPSPEISPNPSASPTTEPSERPSFPTPVSTKRQSATAASTPSSHPVGSEPVMETVTDTYTAITGLRLMQLTELDTTVLFEKQGVSVEIPSGLLQDLNLGDMELLEITITRPQDNAVEISLSAAGTPVTDLTGTVVRLPWEKDHDTALSCRDLAGTHIADVVFEKDIGTVLFEISAPGTYVLLTEEPEPTDSPVASASSSHTPSAEMPVPEPTPEPAASAPSAEEPASIPIAGTAAAVCIVLLCLAGILIYRRWRHG